MSGYRLGGNFYARVDTFSGEVVLGRERGSTKHLCLQIVCKLSNVLVTTPPSPPPPPHGRWQKVPHVEGGHHMAASNSIWGQNHDCSDATCTCAESPIYGIFGPRGNCEDHLWSEFHLQRRAERYSMDAYRTNSQYLWQFRLLERFIKTTSCDFHFGQEGFMNTA